MNLPSQHCRRAYLRSLIGPKFIQPISKIFIYNSLLLIKFATIIRNECLSVRGTAHNAVIKLTGIKLPIRIELQIPSAQKKKHKSVHYSIYLVLHFSTQLLYSGSSYISVVKTYSNKIGLHLSTMSNVEVLYRYLNLHI
jgi:hypothetical protein